MDVAHIGHGVGWTGTAMGIGGVDMASPGERVIVDGSTFYGFVTSSSCGSSSITDT